MTFEEWYRRRVRSGGTFEAKVIANDAWDAATKAALAADEVEKERLRRENDVLRGIATKVMPCHYCAAASMAECPYGFPGCALADDLFPADEIQAMWMTEQRKKMAALEWRPIETAPRDGAPLLLYARAECATAATVVVGWFIDGRWIAATYHPNEPTVIIPTHWMPRPEPPEAK